MDETTPRRSSLAWSLKLDSPGRYPLLLSRLGLSLFGPDDQHNPPARMALIISLGGRLARFGPSLVWLALAGMLLVGSPGTALLWSLCPLLGRLLGLSRQVLLPWSVRVSPHD